MATEKEKALIGEITNLALDIGAGDYDVSIDYAGHVHSVSVRVAKKGASDWVYYGESIYLSGRKDIWREEEAIAGLTEALTQVKKYHPAFDADGVRV